MAVNDEKSTRRMEEAAKYFSGLEKKFWGNGTEDMEIDDKRYGQMLKEASSAASVFSEESDRKKIDETLREHGIVTPSAVPFGISTDWVLRMCKSYSRGNRKIGRYPIEQARRLCDALVDYVTILEKTNKK